MATDSVFIGKSYLGTGSAANPTTGQSICFISAPPKGWYRVVCKYGFGSTPEATTLNNMFFAVNGAMYMGMPLPLPTGPANSLYEYVFERVYFEGAIDCRIAVGNNASAGAVYIATLVITPYEN